MFSVYKIPKTQFCVQNEGTKKKHSLNSLSSLTNSTYCYIDTTIKIIRMKSYKDDCKAFTFWLMDMEG